MPPPDTPATRDGYMARSNRSYKSKSLYAPWWGETNPYADYGVLTIEGESFERQLVWQFIIENYRTDSEAIPGNVTMTWLDETDAIWGGNPQHIHAVGYTDGAPGDVQIRLNRAILPGGAQDQGETFMWDVMAHEWSHAYLINAPSAALELIPPLFGKTMDDWENDDWSLSVKEAFCETFKDVSVTKGKRKFDNRTQLKIPRDKWFGTYDPPPPPFNPPPPGTYERSEVWNVIWALGNPGGPVGWQRYYTSGAHAALTGGVGTLGFNRAMPFPSLYPYAGAASIPGTIEAGGASGGVVLI